MYKHQAGLLPRIHGVTSLLNSMCILQFTAAPTHFAQHSAYPTLVDIWVYNPWFQLFLKSFLVLNTPLLKLLRERALSYAYSVFLITSYLDPPQPPSQCTCVYTHQRLNIYNTGSIIVLCVEEHLYHSIIFIFTKKSWAPNFLAQTNAFLMMYFIIL